MNKKYELVTIEKSISLTS